MTREADARARVRRLVEVARRIRDPDDSLGREARRLLPASTGLSKENVELGLCLCLESAPPDGELEELVRSVPVAARALVLLSANVFVAPHRAIALGLAASSRVIVRASRREGELARLLHAGAPEVFTLVERLEPLPGDHLFAYATDETLEELRRGLPEGVTLHGHGSGVGVVVADADGLGSDPAELARALAVDVALFDQRGCLSPRTVLAVGEPPAVRAFARLLASALDDLERTVPRGRMSPAELAAAARYRDTLLYAGEALAAGEGLVGVDLAAVAPVIPPPGRHVHVSRLTDLETFAAPLVRLVTAVAVLGPPELVSRVTRLFPHARLSGPGRMQAPAFDGPVDRRAVPRVD